MARVDAPAGGDELAKTLGADPLRSLALRHGAGTGQLGEELQAAAAPLGVEPRRGGPGHTASVDRHHAYVKRRSSRSNTLTQCHQSGQFPLW